MGRKTVSILVTDVSSNALSRAYLIAKLLEPEFKIHIIGRGSTDNIWAPICSDTSIEYRFYQVNSAVEFFCRRAAIARHLVEGDIIYACKPLNMPFSLALQARKILSKRFLLDIDDWEIGFLFGSLYREIQFYKINWFRNVNSPFYTRLLDRRIREADAITVSNRFLQARYGGYWLPQARDEMLWSEALASRHHDGPPTVIFLGTPREHKGVDLLLQAWGKVLHPSARLQIIGMADDNPLALKVPQAVRSRIDFVKSIDHSQVPLALSTATVIAIPQRDSRASQGQLPMKLIEAMAAGRAIISTSVGDIPAWLAEGAGLVIPPDNVDVLARGLQYLLDNPQQGEEMGQRARQRFLRFGSFKVHRPKLTKLVADLIENRTLKMPAPAFDETTPLILDLNPNLPHPSKAL
jgi:glycosyltransferase involved in cell wall biosynthesis